MNTDISDFAPVAGIARCESDSWWRDTRKRCRDSRPKAYLPRTWRKASGYR